MKFKKQDLFVGLYLLAAIIFLFVSIPSWLLDIMLAINIAIAMVILFTSYQVRRKQMLYILK